MPKKSWGFTIVELLIVIVVVVIFVAATIMEYNVFRGLIRLRRSKLTQALMGQLTCSKIRYASDGSFWLSIDENQTVG